MPQNAVFDLSAEDITKPTWDELTRAMLGEDPPDDPDLLSCGGVSCDPCADTQAGSEAGG
jgi:hypothetical protein